MISSDILGSFCSCSLNVKYISPRSLSTRRRENILVQKNLSGKKGAGRARNSKVELMWVVGGMRGLP